MCLLQNLCANLLRFYFTRAQTAGNHSRIRLYIRDDLHLDSQISINSCQKLQIVISRQRDSKVCRLYPFFTEKLPPLTASRTKMAFDSKYNHYLIVILPITWEEGIFAPFPKVFHQMKPLTQASFLREDARSDSQPCLTQNTATLWQSAEQLRYSSSPGGLQRQQRLETDGENKFIWIPLCYQL